jgi:hypothetical protein
MTSPRQLSPGFEDALVSRSVKLVGQRALAILGQEICESTDLPVDFATGHCGDAEHVDESHTHCPFCGSAGECPHLIAEWNDDFGYSGPDIPPLPEDWSVPEDWTAQQLQDVLGDLRPAFELYAEPLDFNVFWELVALLDSEIRRVDWWGSHMPAGVGGVVYAADPRSATAEFAALTDRLQAAILQLEPLRGPLPEADTEPSV